MLAAEADRMAPARVPEDLWRRGRRRYQRRLAGAVVAVLTVLAVALTLPGMLELAAEPPSTVAAPAGGAVPGRVFDPRVWQAPVTQSPGGSAAVLLSGSGKGLGGGDLPGMYGSKIASVGRDGSYRMLRYADTYLQVGQQVQLSPDGRFAVGPDAVEDLIGSSQTQGRLSVVNLATGHTRHFKGLPAAVPVAWQPDSAALLLWHKPGSPPIKYGETPPFDGNETKYGYVGGSLWLLDVATGGSRKVLDIGTAAFDPINSAAFAPDGRHLAVQLDRTLALVNTADGSSLTLATLSAGQRLAGTGAFTADGTRLALFDRDGCAVACTHAARNQRQWRLVTLDAATGQPGPDGGFDRVPGAVVRLAGWQRNGTAVVVTYQNQQGPDYDREPSLELPTAYRTVSAANLLAVRPGGGTTQLIHPEGVQIWDIDVAHDLVLDGRFGGPSPKPAVFPAAGWLYWLVLTPTAGLLLIVVLIVRWRRRARRWRPARDSGAGT
ncbi:hypothetical protein Drose_15695 [Dactylosporangium roseum]|uniref:WD40 repeat protein n=1 Tax=Dactylosporangium roseum TaxID=47989 RepID=A0ABY5ZBS4_9ACTN|nr:hypothetical protein [Dactylosporangium roseum]UWZ39545.1 hypothetical protein Drose_15695 [Dactylosporangium roseum]